MINDEQVDAIVEELKEKLKKLGVKTFVLLMVQRPSDDTVANYSVYKGNFYEALGLAQEFIHKELKD